MTAGAPDLTIIIPAYNEEQRLPPTLEKIAAYVHAANHTVEVIVVDDGSKDKTISVAESFRGMIPTLRVVSNGENRGKGFSVRRFTRGRPQPDHRARVAFSRVRRNHLQQDRPYNVVAPLRRYPVRIQGVSP